MRKNGNVETDKRVFKLIWEVRGLKPDVELCLFQVDLLRIIRALKNRGLFSVSGRLERFVLKVDEISGESTCFEREFPRTSIIRDNFGGDSDVFR